MKVDLLHRPRKKDWPALKGPAFCGICGSSAAKSCLSIGAIHRRNHQPRICVRMGRPVSLPGFGSSPPPDSACGGYAASPADQIGGSMIEERMKIASLPNSVLYICIFSKQILHFTPLLCANRGRCNVGRERIGGEALPGGKSRRRPVQPQRSAGEEPLPCPSSQSKKLKSPCKCSILSPIIRNGREKPAFIALNRVSWQDGWRAGEMASWQRDGRRQGACKRQRNGWGRLPTSLPFPGGGMVCPRKKGRTVEM